jgi:hypothetical protein
MSTPNPIMVMKPSMMVCTIPRKYKVSHAALWAELKRSQLDCNARSGLRSWLEFRSGCLVHVESQNRLLKLYGTDQGVGAAIELLNYAARYCIEERVQISSPFWEYLHDALKGFADAHDVTIRHNAHGISVLGFRAEVNNAIKKLYKPGSLTMFSGCACCGNTADAAQSLQGGHQTKECGVAMSVAASASSNELDSDGPLHCVDLSAMD